VLALAAQETRVAMGLGSQRAAVEDPELAPTFQVRKFAPDILLFANLGAVQFNYGYTVDQCQRVVDMVEADGLILHVNPLQEVLQPEGDTRFSNLLSKIETVCRKLEVPVVVKEVGFGIGGETARKLFDVGVSAVDVAGTGGTSWSQVEMYRNSEESARRVAASFRNWGIPTADAIQQVRQMCPEGLVFASGGLRDGVDIAKCIGLGAELGGMAGRFLKAAVISLEETITIIREIEKEIRICMFLISAETIDGLQGTKRLIER
jgi:isopentenyl-diphosphate delta-isomerase